MTSLQLGSGITDAGNDAPCQARADHGGPRRIILRLGVIREWKSLLSECDADTPADFGPETTGSIGMDAGG